MITIYVTGRRRISAGKVQWNGRFADLPIRPGPAVLQLGCNSDLPSVEAGIELRFNRGDSWYQWSWLWFSLGSAFSNGEIGKNFRQAKFLLQEIRCTNADCLGLSNYCSGRADIFRSVGQSWKRVSLHYPFGCICRTACNYCWVCCRIMSCVRMRMCLHIISFSCTSSYVEPTLRSMLFLVVWLAERARRP